MSLSSQQQQMASLVYKIARSHGLPDHRAREMVAAAYAESGLNPTIRNKTSGATGLFQLLSSGYVNRAKEMGGAANPRANTLAIIGDYVNYWKAHPNAAPGEAARDVERSGEGAGFYSSPLRLLSGFKPGEVTGIPDVSTGSTTIDPLTATPVQKTAADIARQFHAGAVQQLQSIASGELQPTEAMKSIGTLATTLHDLARTPIPDTGLPAAVPPAASPGGAGDEASVTPSPGVKFIGKSLQGMKMGFTAAVSQAARAMGATQIEVISGYRSPSYNRQVGGAQRSNHMTGQAMDAKGYVPGKGWVPLGTLIAPVADRYGLRSGDAPGFFHGARDPNHVDNGANQR